VRRGTGLPEVAVAVATTSGLAVVDAAAGRRMVLAGLLAVGPCLAAVSGRPRIVAATGAYALVLISLLAWWPNRIWGTQHHLLYLAATTAVTVVSIVMPDTSGRRLADVLHQREPTLPVLFMSGYPNGQLGTAYPGGEEVTFIEKPFTADRLLTEVHRALAPAADGADPLAAGTERRNVAG
jgi:CheY-like chemotaxis protein